LKLEYDELLSNFAFNCKLRHYIQVWWVTLFALDALAVAAQSLVAGPCTPHTE